MIKNDMVEAILVLPMKLFYTTDISVTCWILNKNKRARVEHREGEDVSYRDRSGEILFMDLRRIGHPYEKKYIEFTQEDRDLVTDKFKAWRQSDWSEDYCDVPEFCHSASASEIIEKDYTLVPSRYIEMINNEDNADYDEKMKSLQIELSDLLNKENESKKELLEVLRGLGYEIKL